jgi:hypothetical protein
MPQRAKRRVVADARIDPAGAFGRLFFFPERGLGLQVIHQELAGLEALAAVGRDHRHHHDLVERLQEADAVDHAGAQDVEALVGLVDHGLDGLLGHAGVVLQLHRGDGAAVVAVPHRADEAADRAHALVARAQRGELVAQVEITRLDRNTRNAHVRIVASG